MPNELSEKVYPDGTVVKLRDDTAREQIATKANIPTSTANGGFIPLWDTTNNELNYYSNGVKSFNVTIESGNPKIRSQSSSSTYANFSASGYEHFDSYKSIAVTAANGIVGSGNGGYNFNLSREKLSYLNNITSDVQIQITGLDTRVTALEGGSGGGVFEMLTNDRINTPQTEESKTMTVTRGGVGIFNTANDDIKYLWFVFIADGSNIGVDLPSPICIPRAFFTDQKTNFTYRAIRCDVEIRRGEGENRIIWNWTFDNAEALPSEAYRYRIYVAN